MAMFSIMITVCIGKEILYSGEHIKKQWCGSKEWNKIPDYWRVFQKDVINLLP